MQAGGGHAGRFVDARGLDFGMPDGTVATLYGGLGYRYWLGTPGASELVGGSVHFWEPIAAEDAEAFLEELKREVRARVALAVGQRTGLQMTWASESLDRTEWLVVWHPEPDMLDRLHAFEGGWSAAMPPGTRARDLSGTDLSQLARRMGLRRARPGPVRATREHAAEEDTR